MESHERGDASKRGRERSFDQESRRVERALARKIAQTQSAIKRVDLVAAFCACATWALAVLFLGVLLDHWILARGLSVEGRVKFAVFWAASTSIFFLWRLIPALRRRVNLLYAAQTVDETGLDRHNSVLNWFLLRRDVNANVNANADESDESERLEILKNVALQAAKTVKNVPSDSTVDFSSVIRWGIALAFVVAVCAVYSIVSPKNLFTSVSRIVVPVAEIERPQALRVQNVSPGNASIYQGDVVEIEATIPGAKESSVVEILSSTTDGRIVDVATPMERQGGSLYKAVFPQSEDGAQEDLKYCVVVERGGRFESRSEVFTIETRPRPSFRVENYKLRFPPYSGLDEQTFENQGDVRALEGTVVSLRARANAPLKSASLLQDGDSLKSVPMKISNEEPDVAEIEFTLQWKDPNAEERKPTFSTYRLVCETQEGERIRDSQLYDVSMIADLPPTIRWDDEIDERAEVPLNDVLPLRVLVEDPDFGVRSVLLQTSYAALDQGEDAADRPALEAIPIPLGQGKDVDVEAPSPYVGAFVASYDFVPQTAGFNVGDEIEYWGVAFDSKRPTANVALTERRVFVVTDPVDNPAQPQNPSESQENENQSGAGSAGQGEGGQGGESGGEQGGASGESAGQEGGQGESESSDGAQSGAETGESGSDAGESGGESDAESTSNEGGQGESGAENNDSDGDASNEGDATSGGDPSDSESGASEQGSDEAQGEGEPGSQQGEASGNKPNDAEKEGETSPQNAFDEILDFMKEEGLGSGAEGENESETEGEADGDSESSSNGNAPKGNEKNPSDQRGKEEAQEEVDPNFESDRDLDKPTEKADLPTRTSHDKPEEDSPVYQANNPDRIDPNTRRRQREDFEEGDDYLAQNAAPDAQTTKGPENANIALDPLDNSQSVAADRVDPNAREVKGGQDLDATSGTSEIDDSPNADGNTAQSNAELDPNAEGGLGGGDGQSSGESSSQGSENSGASGGSGGNDRGKRNSQGDENKGAPSSGSSDENSRAQGGGGGTGRGDLEAGAYQLAPADSPKLQYAEESSNLVLQYLDEALKDKVPQRLLDKLGWTEEELREFVETWRKMREAAGDETDPAAREKYLDELQRLRFEEYAGLDDSEPVDSVKERRARDDEELVGSRSSSRVKTPSPLEERVRAFSKGIAAGRKSRDQK